MTEQPQARLAETFAEVEDALLSRWPETRLEPSLDRIQAFTELLGDPQRAYPVIHLTGTNGKTSTSRMIDTLLRALDLRTGRFTSPHLERINERICIDGEPLTDEEFVRAFNDVAPYTHLVDAYQPHPLCFFETIVGDGVRRLRGRPRRRGHRRGRAWAASWDATNVADGAVAVVTPIAVDHAAASSATPPDEIAVEKAGIIKPGATAVLAEQQPGPAEVLLRRCAEVGATVVREGMEFGVVSRVPAVGGQMLTLQGLRARVRRGLPAAVRRPPGAERRRSRWPRSRPSPATSRSTRTWCATRSPGRPRRAGSRSSAAARRSCSTPPTTRTAPRPLAAALEDSFAFSPLIGVIGVMADKDVRGRAGRVRAAPGPRRLHAELHCARAARRRARRRPRARSSATTGSRSRRGWPTRSTRPRRWPRPARRSASSIGSGAVLVTGSVVTVGEARAMLRRRGRSADREGNGG